MCLSSSDKSESNSASILIHLFLYRLFQSCILKWYTIKTSK
nr:MAG TPA: hypothetical protein [Caudoviricetes sp.]